MNQGPPLANAPRVVRILHTALLGGLTLCGATLYLVRRLSQPPPVGEARVLTLVLAVVSVGVLVIAVGMLRPRVPERRSEQNPEAYWTDASRAAAIVLWTAIEGAGLVGAVGYFLTAAAAPTVAYALALAALVLFRPGRLEGDGET
ncbi:MAG: hypothetical protein DMD49_09900 [Gemmatimonadetes bacterium]|nr:MAG: hypothetical protein DMD49_09900 [Gemmatimonadota bacterium]